MFGGIPFNSGKKCVSGFGRKETKSKFGHSGFALELPETCILLSLNKGDIYNQRNNKKTKFGGGVHSHYPTMSMEEIEKLPIDKLAGENCALFLWTTFPYLDKQIQLFEKWGFRYTTLGFSWIKTNAKNGAPFFGVGYYAKSNCEICLLGIKVKMKPISNKISSCVISPREAHSKKPSEIRDRIVSLFGDLQRIELFARKSADGWDCWGNERNIQ